MERLFTDVNNPIASNGDSCTGNNGGGLLALVAQLDLQKSQMNAVKVQLQRSLIECTCALLLKNGKYEEGKCNAHGLLLRPHKKKDTTSSLTPSQQAERISSLPLPVTTSKTIAQQTSPPKRASTPGKKKQLPPFPAGSSPVSRNVKKSNRIGAKNIKSLSMEQQQQPSRLTASRSMSALISPIKSPLNQPYEVLLSRPAHEFTIHALSMIGAPAELEYEEVQEMIFNYTKAIEMNTETPDNLAILYARRSTLLAALEDFEASLNDAKSSIDFDPKTSIGYYRKGFALCGLKQFGLAAEAFQQGLAIDIHNNQLHHALMITLKYARTENSPTKGSHITRTGTNFHRRQET